MKCPQTLLLISLFKPACRSIVHLSSDLLYMEKVFFPQAGPSSSSYRSPPNFHWMCIQTQKAAVHEAVSMDSESVPTLLPICSGRFVGYARVPLLLEQKCIELAEFNIGLKSNTMAMKLSILFLLVSGTNLCHCVFTYTCIVSELLEVCSWQLAVGSWQLPVLPLARSVLRGMLRIQ